MFDIKSLRKICGATFADRPNIKMTKMLDLNESLGVKMRKPFLKTCSVSSGEFGRDIERVAGERLTK